MHFASHWNRKSYRGPVDLFGINSEVADPILEENQGRESGLHSTISRCALHGMESSIETYEMQPKGVQMHPKADQLKRDMIS